MDPIAVTAALLRAQMPELLLREGATLMARVASRGETHAVIVLAGIPVTAQVPPEIQAGATLRLKVQEVTPERITLHVDSAVGQPSTPLVGLGAPPALPRAQVAVEEPPGRRRGADGEPADVVSLAFSSPGLGRLDLRLELRGDRLLAEVTTPPGRPLDVAQGASERLRARLLEAGLEPTVTVRPRPSPIDLYA